MVAGSNPRNVPTAPQRVEPSQVVVSRDRDDVDASSTVDLLVSEMLTVGSISRCVPERELCRHACEAELQGGGQASRNA